MATERIMKWKGKSSQDYKYWIWDISTRFEAAPANYIFAKETSPNSFQAIYIGETGDISERFEDHEKWDCITRYGATHVHTHKSSTDKKERCAEESDLLAARTTPCNDQ
jgi:predicted GIY-YIG superfamily endonuclease